VVRRVRVPAYAKLNLSLLVLGKRADGFHELRTVFQTISLADWLEIGFTPAARTRVKIDSNVKISNNLAVAAARNLLKETGIRGHVEIRLEKQIPMGGGLGGGSSDAAAVLLALPVLAGVPVRVDQLADLASGLGSDVSFFLHGGTAVGQGRGEQITPLPSLRTAHVLVVTPPVHVSTAEAYAGLHRPPLEQLTLLKQRNRMKRFQSLVSELECPSAPGGWQAHCKNDFEAVVFARHPLLKALRHMLQRLGAGPARMSGSGSALFGIFDSRPALARAREVLYQSEVNLAEVNFVTRERYRAMWRRALAAYLDGKRWPPQGR
jgi:4-diphosphocytidyl-2-C-methyl-D-erythritol kinase